MIFEKFLRRFRPSIDVGHPAPVFTLPSQTGETVTLSSLLQKSAIVLYFYPFDDTYGCIIESRKFRDKYVDFQKAGAQIVGISADSPGSHQKFAVKHELPFLLLSDPDNKVRTEYKVANSFGLLPGRTTFLIDQKGVIRYRYASQFQYDSHVELSLKELKKLSS